MAGTSRTGTIQPSTPSVTLGQAAGVADQGRQAQAHDLAAGEGQRLAVRQHETRMAGRQRGAHIVQQARKAHLVDHAQLRTRASLASDGGSPATISSTRALSSGGSAATAATRSSQPLS